jgi:hypothetical protein
MTSEQENPECTQEWRERVARMARDRFSRKVGQPPAFPSRWQPGSIVRGELQLPMNDASAFELIAERLEAGDQIMACLLRRPAGEKAYVIKIQVEHQLVYIKFQVKKVFIGRSFHLDCPGGSSDDE